MKFALVGCWSGSSVLLDVGTVNAVELWRSWVAQRGGVYFVEDMDSGERRPL